MKIHFTKLLFLILMVGCGGETTVGERASQEKALGEVPDLVLSEKELAQEVLQAEKGNSDAYVKLEWHYWIRGDMTRYRYWLERGAARKDVHSMQRLALFLSMNEGGGDCKRSIQLLEEGLRLDPPKKTRAAMEMDLQRLRHERIGLPPCGVGFLL